MATQPTSKRVGNKIPQLQPRRLTSNETGSSTEIPYETTDRAQWAAMVNMADANGIQYEAQEGFGKHSIKFIYPYNYSTDPATQPAVNLWEMISNKVQKPILDSANPLAQSIPQSEAYAINQFIQNPTNWLIQYNPGNPTNPDPPSALVGTPYFLGTKINSDITADAPPGGFLQVSSDAGKTLVALIMSGVTSFDVFAPVIRYTQTVNNSYPIPVAFFNVGKIISSASMGYLAGLPNNLLFTLPNPVNPSQPTGFNPVLQYGWYKNAPEVRQIARLKIQLVTSYEFGLWPVDLYGYAL